TLIGLDEYLIPLIKASLKVTKSEYQGETFVATVEVKNTTGVEYLLENQSAYSLHAHSSVVTVPPYGTTKLEVKTVTRLSEIELTFRVLNAVTAPKTHPQIKFNITLP
ncbi:MAG: Sb-PDE family phosphodiesterase, partial [Cyclobacteriaceae bacterium]